MEIRRDRNKPPELESSGNSADPVQVLHNFKVWLLKCSTATSTWSRISRNAVSWWSVVLEGKRQQRSGSMSY
eukprot:1923003-Amphidinium_carterae.1